MLKEVPDPERFGVPIFSGERIVGIEENRNSQRAAMR